MQTSTTIYSCKVTEIWTGIQKLAGITFQKDELLQVSLCPCCLDLGQVLRPEKGLLRQGGGQGHCSESAEYSMFENFVDDYTKCKSVNFINEYTDINYN